jgi:hypothetical protein
MRKQRNDLGNIVGEIFGRLKVVSYAGTDKNQKRRWNCVCTCGNEASDYAILKAGFMQATEEGAEAHRRALVAVSGGTLE